MNTCQPVRKSSCSVVAPRRASFKIGSEEARKVLIERQVDLAMKKWRDNPGQRFDWVEQDLCDVEKVEAAEEVLMRFKKKYFAWRDTSCEIPENPDWSGFLLNQEACLHQ